MIPMQPRVRRVLLSVGAALVFVLAAGCSNYVKRGSALYADGRYIEAAEVFERTEYRLHDSSPRQQAEYGLYRGLTLLVLGDLQEAHHWLTFAYEVERAHPGSLRGNRRALLDRGWFELAQRLRSTPPRGAPPTAIAASQPPAPLPPPVPEESDDNTDVNRRGLR